MPTPTKGPRLGGGPAHERLMLANLARSLFMYKSIKTTETKAKRLRPVAERLITFAKKGDLHNRRRALGIIGDKSVIHELFTEIAPLVELRQGGYTRITKLGFRKGDNASMVQMELVLEPLNAKPKAKADKPVKVVEEAPADETDTDETASDETASDEAASDETTSDETTSDETTSDEAASDETTSDEAASDDKK